MFGIGSEYNYDCFVWAFGIKDEKYKHLGYNVRSLAECWNRKHGNLFKVKPTNVLTTPIGHRMGQEYLKTLKKGK